MAGTYQRAAEEETRNVGRDQRGRGALFGGSRQVLSEGSRTGQG